MNQTSKRLDSFEISQPALEVQQALTRLIIEEIEKQGGYMTFSQFMQMALYQPEFGYYQNGLHKFGEKGDFVTAPEISRYFAQSLANSIANCFTQNKQYSILELGAGSGILASNLLNYLNQEESQGNCLPEKYLILEPSAQLQTQQKQLLKEKNTAFFDRVKWISEMPSSFDGLVIANEVADAIPCERIKKQGDKWYRIGVTHREGVIQESVMEPVRDSELPSVLNESNHWPDGYTTEYRPIIKGWIKSLSQMLNSGAIILIDYGYSQSELYHPQRMTGSLNCFINHHQHDNPLEFVGLQDITAHVDFTQIAAIADDNDLQVSGYTTQAGFLLENGIMQICEQDCLDKTDEQRYQISQELQKLVMPGQMGEVFKVICLRKELETQIKGFTLQDHLHRL